MKVILFLLATLLHVIYAEEPIQEIRVGVLSTYPPIPCGIAEFTKNMIAGMLDSKEAQGKKLSFEVFSIARHGHTGPSPSTPNVSVHQINLKKETEKETLAKLGESISEKKLHCLLVQHENGLFHNHKNILDLMAKVSLDTKIFVFIHTGLPYPRLNRKEYTRDLALYSDGIVALGWKVYKSLHHAYGIDKKKLLYFPHGVGLVPQVKAPKKKKNCINLLMSGIMKPEKGVEVALDALEILLKRNQDTKITLTVAGLDNSHGSFRQEIEEKVQEKGLQNHFKWLYNFFSLAELAEIHRSADIFLAPFLGEVPTSGTLTFAMSCGLPVIATPFGMSGELLELSMHVPEGSSGSGARGDSKISYTKYGAIVPRDSSKKLANAITTLIHDSKRRKDMGAAAEKKIKNLSWTNVGGALVKYIETGKIRHVLPNPYKESMLPSMCEWSAKKAVSFSGRPILEKNGVYSLYKDTFVNINAKIYKGAIVALGIRLYNESTQRRGVKYRETFIYAAVRKFSPGRKSANPSRNTSTYIHIVGPKDKKAILQNEKGVVVTSPNIIFEVTKDTEQSLSLRFRKQDRFAYATGLLGVSILEHFGKAVYVTSIAQRKDWRLGMWENNVFNAYESMSRVSRYVGQMYGPPENLRRSESGKGEQEQNSRKDKMEQAAKEQKSLIKLWGDLEKPVQFTAKISDIREPNIRKDTLEEYVKLQYIRESGTYRK
ncbi:hypothetical protein NEFER03_0963 [Nematocida sp. LUAm3]|nr:hypothetical protein NEFER03_0800 [Nematocida sp. LUAm3]KAI5171658.1 hypothetical protein NEFER03_0963 [Nematocida sp. LUAm3]KAI5176478.1 hypothetical protein NEFER02_2224 [Nematocida sp. LUAm2]KAI5179414.1 hypothetical protein NEFER01_2236 [Nematocida sp. LUAm1]